MTEKNNTPEDVFLKEQRNLENQDVLKKPVEGYWKDAFRRLRKNKLAMFGLVMIIILIITAIFAPMFSKFDYHSQDLSNINLNPGKMGYIFGTDELGRDLFTRVWVGTRYSLIIGISAAAIDFLIGVLYGGISGMSGSKVDTIMMRIAEIVYSVPYMLVVILMSVTFSAGQGASLPLMIIAMTITGWVPTAILVRGQVLQLREQEYIMAAKSMGAGRKFIFLKHILPNALGPILVNVTLTIPRAIFAEATLSFMNLGLQAPLPSLGVLANDGLAVMPVGIFYQILFPAVVISLIMFSFNVLGDGLRDALDPKLRK